MSCNSCAKGFSLLRQEKGCPGCGFSFCTKCLNNKIFLPKINSEAKVCSKCEKSSKQNNNVNQIIPPDAYYKRLAATESKPAENMSGAPCSNTELQNIDVQIKARLKKLKEDDTAKPTSEEEIAKRLQGIKSPVSSTSDADIQYRLAKLKGTPVIINKPVLLPVKDLRTEQEQADDLMKQYMEQNQIDAKYKDGFDSLIGDIESRMQKLKGTNTSSTGVAGTSTVESSDPIQVVESEDEEETVRKMVEKVKRVLVIKAEASAEENEIAGPILDELPFCEICNEDATMRCLGCKYLFCKRCFLDHKDDDDGCNTYEPYKPPKGAQY